MSRFTSDEDRRAPGSTAMRDSAARCEQCGTTWFGQLTHHVAWVARTCRRCGGALHGERRAERSAGRMRAVA